MTHAMGTLDAEDAGEGTRTAEISSGVVVTDLEVETAAFHIGPLSFEVPAGKSLAVVGPTGSGKTLLLRALVGLAPLARGSIQIGDARLDHDHQDAASLAQLRAEVGMSFQAGALLDDETALENVALAVRDGTDDAGRRQQAESALGLLGLSYAMALYPGALSGGMRRRVGLARALVNARTALLCDDVTAGLDPSTAASVMEEVAAIAIARQAALIVTTHDVDVVLPRTDRVAVMESGKVVFLGDANQLGERASTRAFAPVVGGAA